MDAVPLIRASAILPFVNFLNQIGAPTERLLKQTKVPIFALENPQALLPLYQTFDFGVKAARIEGIDDLGLVVGQRTQPTDTGVFGKILSQSLTLYDLLCCIFMTSPPKWQLTSPPLAKKILASRYRQVRRDYLL